MRLFIFAIGGTGSRVVKSLVMTAAAGVKPTDPATGAPYREFEIIPLIVDPHHANEDLRRTDSLLNDYRKLRRAIHGDSADATGFFATKISTLKSILGDSGSDIDDTFLFNLATIERQKFRELISFNSLSEENQAMMQMLFSADQLDTRMNIGFVGSPNIGAVALDTFKNSEEFKAFANVIADGDRIFFISSIFGGTGAAGFPIMVKNMRAADALDITNRGTLMNAPIGALTVLPYFNLEHKEDSPINKADFIVKTQSALHYYAETMGAGSVDSLYYLGDTAASAPYINDPGQGGQRNAAHLVELIGSVAPLHFASEADGRSSKIRAFEYGLERDTATVDFNVLGPETRKMLFMPMVKWHYFSLFLDNAFKGYLGRGFTNDIPRIGSDFLSTDFYRTLTTRFMPKYWDWLEEMDANNRHVSLFNIDENRKLDRVVHGILPKSRLFHSTSIDYNDLFSAMNRLSRKKRDEMNDFSLPAKLSKLFDAAATELVSSRFGSSL